METVTIRVECCENAEGYLMERLLVNGEEVMRAGPLWECPEDAILECDLLGPSDFVSLLKDLISKHNGKRIKFEHEEVEKFEY